MPIKTTNNAGVSLVREPPWRSLWVFQLYRLLLACLLLGLLLTQGAPKDSLTQQVTFLTLFTSAYLVFVASSILPTWARMVSIRVQTLMAVFVDIIALTLIMHTSGGINSGIGMLILVSLAGSSLLLKGEESLLFAALATLAILTEQVFSQLQGYTTQVSYTQAGLLGTACFTITLLALVLGRRAQASLVLAEQRSVDLANLEQVNALIIEQMEPGILVVDDHQRIVRGNSNAWRLLKHTGNEDMLPLATLAPSLALKLNNDTDDLQETRGQLHNGELFYRTINIGGSGTLIYLEDSTQSNQRAQEIKLASLGRMSATIAHEIRNPLGAISHAGQLLGESATLTDGDQRLTEIIRNHTQRLNVLVENVLQVSRRSVSSPRNIELNAWLNQFVHEFEESNPQSTNVIHIKLTDDELKAYMDPTHLHQVLYNLCLNAIQHTDTERRDLSVTLLAGKSDDEDNFLEIIDSGPGITAEVAPKLFEPFFTTAHDSTGLGLYLARELCQLNGANLEYDEHYVDGTCFRIHFGNSPS